jgi:hypothetical protein
LEETIFGLTQLFKVRIRLNWFGILYHNLTLTGSDNFTLSLKKLLLNLIHYRLTCAATLNNRDGRALGNVLWTFLAKERDSALTLMIKPLYCYSVTVYTFINRKKPIFN